jgi:hypothetical protein
MERVICSIFGGVVQSKHSKTSAQKDFKNGKRPAMPDGAPLGLLGRNSNWTWELALTGQKFGFPVSRKCKGLVSSVGNPPERAPYTHRLFYGETVLGTSVIALSHRVTSQSTKISDICNLE